MLILAGISIQVITNTELFRKASQAELEEKRSQIVEWLNLKLIEEQANSPLGTSEEIIGQTRRNIIEHQNELERIGKDINIENISNEEDGEQVDVYFYVVVDKDLYKVDLKGAKFIGELRKFPPVIKLENITNTTNSITVQVSTKRNEGGKIEYYIKTEDKEEYILKTSTTDTSYTFSGLEHTKKYNVKIVAVADNKQIAEILVDRTLESVPNLTEIDITFTYSVDGKEINKKTWTNKNVKVTASTTVTGYTLQTSKDGKTWEDTDNQTFAENGQIYAALYDGTNYGRAATENVLNIDTTAPTVSVSVGTITPNSIQLKVTASDEESGLTASETYKYYIGDTQKESLATNNYTFTGLTSGTQYTLKVIVTDNAGNSTEKTITDTTKSIYTVTYNGNGATGGSMEDSTHIYGIASNLRANTYTKTGYYFKGWSRTSEGTVEYENQASISDLSSINGARVELFAQWEKKKSEVEKAIESGGALSETENKIIKDSYGNSITVPAGFKIVCDDTTNNASTVDKGIVIEDTATETAGNQFVWIPVGTIYINEEKTATKTIELNRYIFDENSTPYPCGDNEIPQYWAEIDYSELGNPMAKSISNFKTSVENNHGYYIGRYEARENSSGTITEIGTDTVQKGVYPEGAAWDSKNMYGSDKPFTSDLINSYAWDTALIFFQNCGTNYKYPIEMGYSGDIVMTGTNNQSLKDLQCNVYDMRGNLLEFTTETSYNGNGCTYRGGGWSSYYWTDRWYDTDDWVGRDNKGFRPILYINV